MRNIERDTIELWLNKVSKKNSDSKMTEIAYKQRLEGELNKMDEPIKERIEEWKKKHKIQ